MSDRARPDTLVGRLIDAVLDVAVISFAAWTLLYCLGLPTQWSLWPSGWIWLAPHAGRAGLAGAAGATCGAPTTLRATLSTAARPTAGPQRRDLVLVAGLGLVALSAVGGLIWTTGSFRFTWAALVLGIVALVGWSWLAGRVRPVRTRPRSRPSRGWSARRSSACWRSWPAPACSPRSCTSPTPTTPTTSTGRSGSPSAATPRWWTRCSAPRCSTRRTAAACRSPPSSRSTACVAHMTGTLAGTINYLVAAPIARLPGRAGHVAPRAPLGAAPRVPGVRSAPSRS